jgi:hypothetical protein
MNHIKDDDDTENESPEIRKTSNTPQKSNLNGSHYSNPVWVYLRKLQLSSELAPWREGVENGTDTEQAFE